MPFGATWNTEDLLGGQKTGWYFDHRDHRLLLASLAPQLPRVLDLYSYVAWLLCSCNETNRQQLRWEALV